jgi:capsular polysaccharide biosynthesis protein
MNKCHSDPAVGGEESLIVYRTIERSPRRQIVMFRSAQHDTIIGAMGSTLPRSVFAAARQAP